jgi:prepilin peptidase CpaA
MTPSLHMLAVLGTLLAVASASDVAMHRIPNALAVGVAATGLLAQVVAGAGFAAFGESVLAVVVMAAVVWPAWARGWIGGGDLKLGAAAAAWVGLRAVPVYVVLSSVAVGALSLACYAISARSARAEVRRNLVIAALGASIAAPLGSENGRVQVPAGVGFAIGALATIAMTGGL